MKKRIALAGFTLILSATICPYVVAQQDEDVRGAFLTTRPKTTDKSAPPKRPGRRPKSRPTASGSVTVTATVPPGGAITAGPATTTSGPRMGMGLTLFMRDSRGMAVRTDPGREFYKGDHVRVLLETNTDGYLYIFNTTDGGKPVMIYPDAELNDGGNYVRGHVPFEIPSSLGAEERLRWFTFDQNSGREKLYFVFTREPLPGIPMEDDLIVHCRAKSGNCPWRPADELWQQVSRELMEPTKVAKSKKVGTSETSAEHEGATRGIGLNRDDPEPTVIVLTASTNKAVLVATMDLNHKG
ncbi:MAG TPA: DUF4384 domain-containing protein [Pyrinomonadaceae bacterium]|nr:DUF4384 domain-containing protein [Pyrinomonadaceae bacterium]